MRGSAEGLGVTVSVLAACFGVAHLALLVMRSILYFEERTWKSPLRLPVGGY